MPSPSLTLHLYGTLSHCKAFVPQVLRAKERLDEELWIQAQSQKEEEQKPET